jgi:hypothetical protein
MSDLAVLVRRRAAAGLALGTACTRLSAAGLALLLIAAGPAATALLILLGIVVGRLANGGGLAFLFPIAGVDAAVSLVPRTALLTLCLCTCCACAFGTGTAAVAGIDAVVGCGLFYLRFLGYCGHRAGDKGAEDNFEDTAARRGAPQTDREGIETVLFHGRPLRFAAV